MNDSSCQLHMSANKKKLAVITNIDSTLVYLLFAQLKAAMESGYEVHCICSKGENFEKLTSSGIRMHAITVTRKTSPFSDLVTLWKMYRLFRKEKFDIVHTHTPKISLLGQVAAKLAGVRFILNTVHGFYFHDNMKPLARWFYVTMERIAARCSTIILSQNPEDIETAVHLKICRREKIRLLGNGVDLSKFNPNNFKGSFGEIKRQELGIPQDSIVVMIIGRLVKEKGFLELFKAMKELMDKHGNLWLIVIGAEEPEKPDAISADSFRDYGIESRTRWLGTRRDIPELLACSDIFTLPSWREGFPRSAIEATAMSLPIVTTDIRGCRQVVNDSENGILVTVKNPEALQQALDKLIVDPDLRKVMGRIGHEKAQNEFDEQKVCEIVLDTYGLGS